MSENSPGPDAIRTDLIQTNPSSYSSRSFVATPPCTDDSTLKGSTFEEYRDLGTGVSSLRPASPTTAEVTEDSSIFLEKFFAEFGLSAVMPEQSPGPDDIQTDPILTDPSSYSSRSSVATPPCTEDSTLLKGGAIEDYRDPVTPASSLTPASSCQQSPSSCLIIDSPLPITAEVTEEWYDDLVYAMSKLSLFENRDEEDMQCDMESSFRGLQVSNIYDSAELSVEEKMKQEEQKLFTLLQVSNVPADTGKLSAQPQSQHHQLS